MSFENNNTPNSGEYHYSRDNAPSNDGGYTPNPNYTPYEPPKKRGFFKGGKKSKPSGMSTTGVVALALVCALVGGLAGGGAIYAASASGALVTGHATATVSDRGAVGEGGAELSTTTVKAGDTMTPAQIYSTYGSAVVSINVQTSSGQGAGTGFIFDAENGYILTCYHVIDGATAISTVLTDSTSYEATYVGGDAEQDIAILKITPDEGTKLNSVVLGDSSLLSVGDTVSAIGNALGTLANTLTSGSVSALDRAISMSDGTVMNLLQTDTTINSGNSGGPLFNEYGEVIGVVNAKYSSSGYTSSTASIEGIGFAIPINDVNDIMEDLLKHGYVTGKPYLGISVATVSSVAAQQYADMVVGAYVNSVNTGSCAETAGLQKGDIITQVDGKDITTSAELIDAKNAHKAGEEMTLTVFRNKEYVTLKVTLDEETPADDSSSNSQQSNGNSGDYDYGYGYSNGNGNGNGNSNGNSYGYSFPFSFYGW